MKLRYAVEVYSVSWIWADSDKKMRIYSSASIEASIYVKAVRLQMETKLIENMG